MMITALAAITLLLGPCLSIVSVFGGGAAHAHGTSAHGSMHGAAASSHGISHIHDMDSGNPETHTHDHGDHKNSPLDCGELCEGWAVKKSQRFWIAANYIAPDPQNSPAFLAILAAPPSFFIANRFSRQPGALPHAARHAATAPVYALTGRYRL